MLSHEQNELLTRVGRGTPMGTMMRRYWHPIAISAELPERDGDPVVRKLLGDTFVLFRDTQGRVGAMDEGCLHRGASMALGRVEEGGIRCIYHGWKFDVEGKLLETPNIPDERIRERLRANAYPVREQSGLIWIYIGPKDKQPPFRRFAYDEVPETHHTVVRVNIPSNYLQNWEGGTDSSHVSILHSNVTRPGWLAESKAQAAHLQDFVSSAWDDMAPKLEIEDTHFGFHYAGIRRTGQEGMTNVRVVPLFLPYGRMIPLPGFESTILEVPLDDFNTSTYLVDLSVDAPISVEARLKRSGFGPHNYRGYNFIVDKAQHYGQDRVAMREKRSWTGLEGLTQEDATVTVSQGSIYDRSTEHLVSSDAAVVRLRRRLMQAVEVCMAGGDPPGALVEDMTGVRCVDQNLELGRSWRALTPGHMALPDADARG
ncbi:Phthalate 4,5-dioxygenase oxygenase subunit [Variovorax sp. SRS16]|nr:Phthalate 4,5-dioxygenase oxygenase subunit [Variovorax sp. SRS16]